MGTERPEVVAPVAREGVLDRAFRKALDRMLDPALCRSVVVARTINAVEQVAEALYALAVEVGTLATNVQSLTRIQEAHNEAIGQLAYAQHVIFQRLRANALDTSMPKIKQMADEEPTSDAAKSRTKPN